MSVVAIKGRNRKAKPRPFNLAKTITQLRTAGRRSEKLVDHEIPTGLPPVIEGAFGPDGPVDRFGDFDRAFQEEFPAEGLPKPSGLRENVSTFFYRLERTVVYVLDRLGGAALKAVDRYENRGG